MYDFQCMYSIHAKVPEVDLRRNPWLVKAGVQSLHVWLSFISTLRGAIIAQRLFLLHRARQINQISKHAQMMPPWSWNFAHSTSDTHVGVRGTVCKISAWLGKYNMIYNVAAAVCLKPIQVSSSSLLALCHGMWGKQCTVNGGGIPTVIQECHTQALACNLMQH